MTGLERCMLAIAGEQTDRIPAYTPSIASDVASAILGRPAHTGGPELWYAEAIAWSNGQAAWREFDAQVAEDVIDLWRTLDQDVIRFPWRYNIKPDKRLDERTFLCGDPDGDHQIWQWVPDNANFVPIHTPPPAPVEDWPRMAREAAKNLESFKARIREFSGVADAALQQRVGDAMLVPAGGAGLSLGVDETALLALLMEPGAVSDRLDCALEAGLVELEALAQRGIRVVLGGGDMADKNGPLYSPEMFRRFMLPRWKKIADHCRKLGLHYVWRSDGNLWKVSDMLFIEAAIPGFGEVDYDASMTCSAVRERYPDLAVWGNISGDILRRADRETVYTHCCELIEAGGGTRYFHGCSNTILPGTPVENVYAMMQARDDAGTR